MNNLRLILLTLAVSLLLSACDKIPSWMGGATEEKPKLPGERVTVIPVAEALTPDPVMKALAVTLPPVSANADWPQHMGIGNLAGGEFSNREDATAGEGEEYGHVLVPRPVVAAGTVFAMDAVGNLSAHDAANIDSVRWQSKGISEKDEPDILGGGLAYEQGVLYATSGRGATAAFDASSGKMIWRKALHVPLRSAPRVSGGRVFVVTIDNQMYALNAASGDILWTQRGIAETAGIMNSVSPVVAGEAVIEPYSSGELYALTVSEGREIWNNSLSLTDKTQASGLFAGIGGDPVVDGQVVFAVSSGGLLTVFDVVQGRRLWDKPVAAVNTPWVAGDYLFLLTADNTLVSFVKYSGQVRWSTKLVSFEDEARRLHPITWKGPVLVDGKLAVVSSNGKMMLISAADGSILRENDIPDGIYTAPVVAGGKMYLIGQDAKLYSLH